MLIDYLPLIILSIITLTGIPILSIKLGQKHLKDVFILPKWALISTIPLFILTGLLGESPIALYTLFITLSLWTGGFFGMFFAYYYYNRNKNLIYHQNKK
ncbi:MAG: hypothetical protein ACNA7K_04820 [Acholeplasmataceae bacterium]